MMAIIVMAPVVLVPAVVMAAMPAIVPARTVAIEAVMSMASVPAMGLRLCFHTGSRAGEGEAGDKREQQHQFSHDIASLCDGWSERKREGKNRGSLSSSMAWVR